NTHLLNPPTTTSSGTMTMTEHLPMSYAVGAGREGYYSFPDAAIGAPITVAVSMGPAVIASQRVICYGSFNEVRARPASAAATTSYFNWYDRQSAGMRVDNVHILNPGATAASGTVAISGGPSQNVSVAAGQEQIYSFPAGTIGGPITVMVTSGPGVVASQRGEYYQSFNEVSASQ